MNQERWRNAASLVEAIRHAEEQAETVRTDAFALHGRGPEGVSHPTEDEARAIKTELAALRKRAVVLVEREGAS